LPERALGDLLPELDDARDLEERETLAAEREEVGFVHRVRRDDDGIHDLLAGRSPGNADDDRLADLRMRDEHVLDLDGIDLVARDLDEELLPSGYPQAAVPVDPPEVTGEEEAVAEHLAVVLLHVVVAARHGRRADRDLADLARGKRPPGVV